MIALVAAVSLETELLRRRLSPCEAIPAGRRELLRGRLFEKRVCLLHTGLGKANAAAATALLLEKHRPQAVMLFGCGGAYPGSGLGVGDLALASEEIYGDEGVITPAGFRDLETIGFPTLQQGSSRYFNRFPVTPSLLESSRPDLEAAAASAGRRLVCGPFVTVSTCSGTALAAEEMARRTGGICESMEGAAVAQVCTGYGVPFLELRGISNLTEDRDLSTWDLKGAAAMAQQGIMAILRSPAGTELAG